MALDGAKYIEQDGAKWSGIVCSYHRGEAAVDYETRIDPATGEPRTTTYDLDGESVTEVVMFPIYSEDVGHQGNCIDCQEAEMNTRHHISMVTADREQGEFELRRRMREMGL